MLVKHAHVSQFVYKGQAHVFCLKHVDSAKNQRTATEKTPTQAQNVSFRRMKPNKTSEKTENLN